MWIYHQPNQILKNTTFGFELVCRPPDVHHNMTTTNDARAYDGFIDELLRLQDTVASARTANEIHAAQRQVAGVSVRLKRSGLCAMELFEEIKILKRQLRARAGVCASAS